MKLRIVRLVLTASVALMITACGQKGPLYLPEKEAPGQVEAPAAAPASEPEATASDADDKSQDKEQADRPDQ